MIVLTGFAVHAQPPDAGREGCIVGGQKAAVAGASQVFGWEETEAADRSQDTGAPFLIFGADRLAGVFDDRNAGRRGEPLDRFHFGALAEQVNGHNGLGPRRNRGGHRLRIEIEARRLDITKDGRRPQPVNRTGRGEEAIRAGDDFVARSDVECHQGQQQRIGPRRTADRFAGVAIAGELEFQLGDFVAQNKSLFRENPADSSGDLRFDLLVLSDQVDQRDWFRSDFLTVRGDCLAHRRLHSHQRIGT
jgi:hypothetical protein